MKKFSIAAAVLLCIMLLSGCTQQTGFLTPHETESSQEATVMQTTTANVSATSIYHMAYSIPSDYTLYDTTSNSNVYIADGHSRMINVYGLDAGTRYYGTDIQEFYDSFCQSTGFTILTKQYYSTSHGSILEYTFTYTNENNVTCNGMGFVTLHDTEVYAAGVAAIDNTYVTKEYQDLVNSVRISGEKMDFSHLTTLEQLSGSSTSDNRSSQKQSQAAVDSNASSLFDVSYAASQYKSGTDIPAGEYVLLATDDYAYFCLSSDANQNTIICNDSFETDSIVSIQAGEYLSMDDCIAIPADEFYESHQINTDSNGTMLKVGYDLDPGEYKLTATNGDGYYCIYNDSRQQDIETNDFFSGSTYISLHAGQYLSLDDCRLEQ